MIDASPSTKTNTIDETFFDLVETLCGRFIGLSPFEVLNMETRDVFDLYVDVIIHDRKNNKGNANETWVTSANASWH